MNNYTEFTLNINTNSKSFYSKRLTNLTEYCFIILYVIIQLISTKTLILKFLIVKYQLNELIELKLFIYLVSNF